MSGENKDNAASTASRKAVTGSGRESKKLVEDRNPILQAARQEAFMLLRRAMAQCFLFDVGSPQFDKVAQRAFQALSATFEFSDTFGIHIAESKVVINDQLLEMPRAALVHVQYVERLMASAGTSSINFAKGITYEEFGAFLHLLTRQKLFGTDGAKMNNDLRQQGITHVTVNEVHYVPIDAQEKIVALDIPTLSQHAAAQPAVGKLMNTFDRMLTTCVDEEARSQLRTELCGQVLDHDTDMLRCNLAAVAQRGNTTEASLLAVIKDGPREHLLLADVTALAHALSAHQLPVNDPAWAAVRGMISRLTEPLREHSEELLAKVEIDPVLYPLLPDWLHQAVMAIKDGAASERLAGILTQSPPGLLNDTMFNLVVDVFDELSVAGMDAEAEQLITHIAGALHALTKEERALAVTRLSFLLGRTLEQNSAPVKILEDALLDACTHETCDEVMKLLLAHLGQRAAHHFKLGNFARALEHLQWIVSLEESSRTALREEGANLARDARETLAHSEFAATLLASIQEWGEKGRAAGRLARLLGLQYWPTLIRQIKAEFDPERLDDLMLEMQACGADAAQGFLAELAREQDGPTAVRMLQLSTHLAKPPEIVPHLAALAVHPDAGVRAALARFLAQHDDEETAAQVGGLLLHEADPARRKQWVAVLSQLRHPSSLQHLLNALNAVLAALPLDEGLVLALLAALGRWDDHRIIEPLARLVCPHPAAPSLDTAAPEPAKPKAVTLAAMKALARFYREAVVSEAYERARRERDPEIARYAVVCIHGVVAAEQAEEGTAAADALRARGRKSARLAERTHQASAKAHTGFEELEARGRVQEAFQPGAAIAGTAPRPTNARDVRPAEPLSGPLAEAATQLSGAKATLQGRLEDMRAGTVLALAGGKDGILSLTGSFGRAFIFVRRQHITAALCGSRTGLEALAAVAQATSGAFTYHGKDFTWPDDLNVAISELDNAIQQWRAQQ